MSPPHEQNGPTPSPFAPTLDRNSEPWVGEFPGLGRVLVAADGAVTVELADTEAEVVARQSGATTEQTSAAMTQPTESLSLREAALRHGWGEPLSWVRRGFHMVGGAAVGPADSPTCLLLLGDPHDVAIMVLELLQRDWQLLSDRPTPVNWEGDRLLAHPRQAPLLVSERRAAKAGVGGDRIRTDSDALAVAVTRAKEPRQVAAAVQIRMRRPNNETLQILSGHERFEAATSLYVGGVLDPTAMSTGDQHRVVDDADAPAPSLLAEHLRISQLPWVRLHMSSKTAASDAVELVKWWDAVPYDRGSENG